MPVSKSIKHNTSKTFPSLARGRRSKSNGPAQPPIGQDKPAAPAKRARGVAKPASVPRPQESSVPATPEVAGGGVVPRGVKTGAAKATSSRPVEVPKDDPATTTERQTKKASCLAMLARREGASIEELMEATGWQAHSVRGFLSGEVRKRLGKTLSSEVPTEGDRRYRIGSVEGA